MFKPVNVGSAVDIKQEGEGASRIGVYTGHKEIQTQFGEQTIYQFTAEDGTPFGIYGFSHLNKQMESVGLGKKCQIVYKGTAKVMTKYSKTPKDVHQVEVSIWEDESEETEKTPF